MQGGRIENPTRSDSVTRATSEITVSIREVTTHQDVVHQITLSQGTSSQGIMRQGIRATGMTPDITSLVFKR